MNFFSLGSDPPPEETILLSPEPDPGVGSLSVGYHRDARSYLGDLDFARHRCSDRSQNQVLSPVKDWQNELQRPLYFLRAPDAFFCGWCELDPSGERLILVPYLLSPASSLSWNYPNEVEIVGRVVARSTPYNLVPFSSAPPST
jgi:hypothetical protein